MSYESALDEQRGLYAMRGSTPGFDPDEVYDYKVVYDYNKKTIYAIQSQSTSCDKIENPGLVPQDNCIPGSH